MLHDPNYINEIKKIIQECETEYDNLEDRGLAWEDKTYNKVLFCSFQCQKEKRKTRIQKLIGKTT